MFEDPWVNRDRVDYTLIHGFHVSTVRLPPILRESHSYETMVFRDETGYYEYFADRYDEMAEAIQGHANVVQYVKDHWVGLFEKMDSILLARAEDNDEDTSDPEGLHWDFGQDDLVDEKDPLLLPGDE